VRRPMQGPKGLDYGNGEVSVRAARRLMGRDGDLVTGWYEEGETRERRRRKKRCQKD
jgi:hypothetical protein